MDSDKEMDRTPSNNIEESNVFYFLRLIVTNWKKLFILYFLVGLITVITLLILPHWYRSTATVIILEERGPGGMATALSEALPFNIGGLAGINTDRYIQFTKTKKLQDRVIDRFNLSEVYETSFAEDTYEAFNNNFYIFDNDNNTFDIAYSFKNDPARSAEITNYIYEVLNDIALEVDKAQASNFREYLEMYLDSQERKLQETREEMIQFQNESGIINLPVQVEATVEALASFEVSRTEILLQIEYLRNVVSEDSRDLRNLQQRYEVYNKQIENLRARQNMPLLAIEGLPERAALYLELQRDIVVGEQVTEFVRVQYEEALIEEQKISSNLYLLDPAQIPEKRFKPQRARTLVIVMFLTVLFSLVYIRAEDYYREHEESFRGLFKN